MTIGQTEYTEIKNLDFAQQTDLTMDTLPVNEFTVDILTDDTITIGQKISLYDDKDQLWAEYYIVYAEHLDKATVRVRGRSALGYLDGVEMPAEYYASETAANVIAEIFGDLDSSYYFIFPSLETETITGFCPKQTARQRLQWVCVVLGAYVRDMFAQKVRIVPIDPTESVIPMDRTFWRPSVTYEDYVTALKVTAYTFTAGTPAVTDKWVTDGTTTWIVTEQEHTLANPDAPAAAPENVVTLEGVYLINSTNVSAVLSFLSRYYFKRQKMDADVINNRQYLAGGLVAVYENEDSLLSGYIESMTFSFGVQARSRIRMTVMETRETTSLIIKYLYGDIILGTRTYYLPVGYEYSIENPYLDMTFMPHRYVYRPEEEYAEGTIAAGTNTDEEEYQIALDFSYTDNVLYIISVDELEDQDEEGVVIIT